MGSCQWCDNGGAATQKPGVHQQRVSVIVLCDVGSSVCLFCLFVCFFEWWCGYVCDGKGDGIVHISVCVSDSVCVCG